MRLPEQKLWDTMKRQYQKIVPPAKIHMDRIENAAGEGQPDVHCRSFDYECWVELKVAKLPKRETTRVMGAKGLNGYQENWHLVHSRCLLKSFVLLRDDQKGLYFIPGNQASEMNNWNQSELNAFSWANNWEDIFRIIKGGL